MRPYDYIIAMRRTCSGDVPAIAARASSPNGINLLHAAMGLATESGEVVDAIKKHLFYGKPIDRVNLIEEAGDVLWYLALLLDTIGVPFEEAMDVNIAKLRERFPDKFGGFEALNRDLTAERQVLEQGVASPVYRPLAADDPNACL